MNASSPSTSRPSVVEPELELRVREDDPALPRASPTRSGRARARSARPRRTRSSPTSATAAARSMFSSWPVCAFVAGVKIGSGSCSDSVRPAGSSVAADRAGREVVLPARAGEVAADDALDRQHLEAPALGRAAVAPQREQVVRHEVARLREPERREPGEHAALVGDLGRQHDVEGRDPVARDEQQAVVVERVQLADLAARRRGRRCQTCTGSSSVRERCEALEDGVDVADGRLEVEHGRERGRVQARCDLGVGRDERAEVALLVPRLHRVPLHEPVRLAAREPRLDEREQQPVREHEPVRRVEVAQHPLRDRRRGPSTIHVKRSSM